MLKPYELQPLLRVIYLVIRPFNIFTIKKLHNKNSGNWFVYIESKNIKLDNRYNALAGGSTVVVKAASVLYTRRRCFPSYVKLTFIL